ncbi:MAG: AAA family ATPase [Myxococcales bacterium]|nr:AAA family ATPase [Myxococcales bacterium]
MPRGLDLDAVFLHRATRHVATTAASFRGQLLEGTRGQRPASRAALRAIRADRVAKVFVAGRFFCDTVPLDRFQRDTPRRRWHPAWPTERHRSPRSSPGPLRAHRALPRTPFRQLPTRQRRPQRQRQRRRQQRKRGVINVPQTLWSDRSSAAQERPQDLTKTARTPPLPTPPPGDAALRNLRHRPSPTTWCSICATPCLPLDLYRTLAQELGVAPSHRPASLDRHQEGARAHGRRAAPQPVLVLDEAQHLSDRFLLDLSGFLNFAFDSRELLTLWLVGLPALGRTLAQQQHAPLAMRIQTHVHIEPCSDRDGFAACIHGGLEAVGARQSS